MKEDFETLIDSIQNRDIVKVRRNFDSIIKYNLENIQNISSNDFIYQEDILNFHTFSAVFNDTLSFKNALSNDDCDILESTAQETKKSLKNLFYNYKTREQYILEIDTLSNLLYLNDEIETIIIKDDFSIEVQLINKSSKYYSDIESMNSDFEIYDFNEIKSRYYDFVYEFKESATIQEYAKTSLAIETPSIFNNVSIEEFKSIFKNTSIYFHGEETNKELVYIDLKENNNLGQLVNLLNNLNTEELNGYESIQDNTENKKTESLFEKVDFDKKEGQNAIQRL